MYGLCYGVKSVCRLLLVFSLIAMCGLAENPATQESSRGVQANELPVHYIRLPTGQYSPANVDRASKTVYVWRDVVLAADQVPNTAPWHRMPIIDLNKDNWNVQDGFPCVQYVRTDEKTCAVGYYDASSKTFYGWSGLQLRRDDVPEKYRAVDMGDKDDSIRLVEIQMPLRVLKAIFAGASEDEDVSRKANESK